MATGQGGGVVAVVVVALTITRRQNLGRCHRTSYVVYLEWVEYSNVCVAFGVPVHTDDLPQQMVSYETAAAVPPQPPLASLRDAKQMDRNIVTFSRTGEIIFSKCTI